jgi:hypothetical protein
LIILSNIIPHIGLLGDIQPPGRHYLPPIVQQYGAVMGVFFEFIEEDNPK